MRTKSNKRKESIGGVSTKTVRLIIARWRQTTKKESASDTGNTAEVGVDFQSEQPGTNPGVSSPLHNSDSLCLPSLQLTRSISPSINHYYGVLRTNDDKKDVIITIKSPTTPPSIMQIQPVIQGISTMQKAKCNHFMLFHHSHFTSTHRGSERR
jgi:hypothetical protein